DEESLARRPVSSVRRLPWSFVSFPVACRLHGGPDGPTIRQYLPPHKVEIFSPSTAGARAPVFLDFGRNRGGQLGDIGVAPGAYAGTVYEVAQAALDLAAPLWQDMALVQASQLPLLAPGEAAIEDKAQEDDQLAKCLDARPGALHFIEVILRQLVVGLGRDAKMVEQALGQQVMV